MSLATTLQLLSLTALALALSVLLTACGSDQLEEPRDSELTIREQVGGATVESSPESVPTAASAGNGGTPWPAQRGVIPGTSTVAVPTASVSIPPPATLEKGLAGFLRLIPMPSDGGYWHSVYLNDYKRMREAHGIQAPEKDATGADIESYLTRIGEETGVTGPWLSGYHPRTRELLEVEGYLRFGIGNVDGSIWAEDLLRTLEAMTGRFDPEATGTLLSACAECPEPETLEHGGIEFYSWGEDLTPDLPNRLQPPAFDPLGRGGRIAVLDSLVLRTIETEGMRHLIDTHLDNRDSLADDSDLALAAGALDGLGVYSGLLFGDVAELEALSLCDLRDGCDEEALAELRSQLGMASLESRRLDEYILLGTGVGHDEDGFCTAFVFVYQNEDVAERNVGVFENNLAEGFSIYSDKPWAELFPHSEVWNEDRTLIAKLRTESTVNRLIYLFMVVNRDSLILWDQ